MPRKCVRDMPRRQQKAVFAKRNRAKLSRNERIKSMQNYYGISRKQAIAELKDMGEY